MTHAHDRSTTASGRGVTRHLATLCALALVAVGCSGSDESATTASPDAPSDTAASAVDTPTTDPATGDEPTPTDAATPDTEAPAEPAPEPEGACAVDEVDGDLALFNWSEYIDPEQIAEFESTFGVSVSQDSYDSNESMVAIVSQGNSGYDVIVPSDYMVGIMRDSGNLQPLIKSALPNMANLLPEFVGLEFDPGNDYSVPYQAGTTGIGVDLEVLGDDFPRSWGLIFDPAISDAYSGKITLLNDARETLGAALKYLGYSVNTTDDGELQEATDLIRDSKGRLAAFDTDSADELLISGETAIAHAYSGDAFAQIIDTDDPERYEFFVPEEGGVRWIDNMAIPFDAPHPCTAHTFINWLLDGEQGAALTNWNYYTTPNAAALPGLDEELVDFISDDSIVIGGPDSLELIRDTGDFEINFSDAFVEAKS